MGLRLRHRIFCAGIAFVAMPAVAQPAPASENPAACELHIWPTREIDARSSGWLSALGLVGTAIDRAQAAAGDRRRRTAVEQVLDPSVQLRLVAAADPAWLLTGRRARLVLHDEPVEARAIRRLPTRRATSASPCYSELYVRRVSFRKSAFSGRQLIGTFVFRDFGAAPSEPRRWDGSGESPLARFPPTDAAAEPAAAEELRAGFARTFRDFATGLLMRMSGAQG